MVSIEQNKQKKHRGLRRTALSAAAVVLCAGFCASASAAGDDDLVVRLDNTLRYNFGKRVDTQDKAILASPNNDDGDRNFAKNSTVANRVDLLTEFDIVYDKKFGARLTAASWYDQAYANGFDNTSLATSNHLVNGAPAFGLSDYARRFSKGFSGEWMDAFMFGSFNLGDMPLTVRAGRHTVTWGESLLGGGAVHGVAAGQSPLDQGKALAIPGTEAKELFRPLAQISGQLQATPTLSLAAQYYFQWEATKIPESGTYLGFSDALDRGGESLISSTALPVSIGRATRGTDITPRGRGDFGLAARWSPEWLDGTMGFYYRNYSDKNPQIIALLAPTGLPGALAMLPSKYFLNYASGVDLYGISLSKQVAGISFGMDLNYRKNMPLMSDSTTITSVAQLPARGDILSARGTTVHGVLNALGAFNSTPLFNSASWAAELTWNRYLEVTSDPFNRFKGRDGYTAIDRVSKDFYGLALNFTPTWFQVLPGADLSMPLSASAGLKGNSAVGSGGNQDSGNFAAGLALDFYGKYRFDLKYVDYFGKLTLNAAGAIAAASSTTAYLKDRGAVFLTFKTTF